MNKKNGNNARKGSLNPTSKLTEEQVLAIRKKYSEGGSSHRALASEFGVGKATITRILSGKNWGWLLPPKENQGGNGTAESVQTLDPEEWLANNKTFYCESLKARITFETCSRNREMAKAANHNSRKSGILGHPLYESAARDRLHHCGSCPHATGILKEASKKNRKSSAQEDLLVS
ncbi:MAG: hypothetical protein JRI34_12115 [Deltaproteobacteria bacterium]|nr:hypothetical protein [Deltaproteobacteria bacterium]